ncbi:hypothetical protein, partial [Petrachloros mirabilis]
MSTQSIEMNRVNIRHADSADLGAHPPAAGSLHRAGCEDGWAGRRQAPCPLKRRAPIIGLTLLAAFFSWNDTASAFCGFYVGKADTKLFNKASEVAIA